MEIKNFGQALQLALKLEDAGLAGYDHAAQNADDETLKNLFAGFFTASKKRRKIIEAIYKENVNSDMDSGILAPIKPMSEAQYLTRFMTEESLNTHTVHEMEELETKTETFYKDFFERLDSSPRSLTKRIKKLSEENASRRIKLKDYGVSKK